jgi:hypothetical protein
LAGLWADVLRIPLDIITLDNSFFAMGGDSIATMGLVGEAADNDFVLSVADIFRHPRQEEVAQSTDSNALQTSTDSAVKRKTSSMY